MKNILSKYIFKQVLFTSFSVGFIIVAALWIIQSLRFVELVLNTRASFLIFLQLALLTLPDLLAIVLPVAVFMSILFVYHRFIMDREVVVMQSAGVSTLRLARPTIVFATILMFALLAINVFISPSALRSLRDMELQLRNALPAVLIQEGVFNTLGSTTIYVQKKRRDHLMGIFAYVHDVKQKKYYAVMAQEGKLIQDKSGPQILMIDGNRQEMDQGKISILYFDQTVISLAQEPQKKSGRHYKPYELPLLDLLVPDPSLSPAQQQRLKSEGHQRLLSPLLVLAFTMIALSCMLLHRFSRRGMIFPIILAVICAVGLESMVLMLLSLGAAHSYAIIGNYVLVLSVFFGGIFLLGARTKLKAVGVEN